MNPLINAIGKEAVQILSGPDQISTAVVNNDMNTLIDAVRKEAARILREGKVDVVIGFEEGTLPFRARPVFITSPEDAERLVINGFCQNNLACYVTRIPKERRIGIICRGCESRAIRTLVLEHQHERDKMFLIGIPCTGIIDERKMASETGNEVIQAEENGDEIVITSQYRLRKEDVLHDSCKRCVHRNPVGTDVLLGPRRPKGDPVLTSAMVSAFEEKPPEERYAFFAGEVSRCIRCYACRQACPMCYCTECFVDHTAPRWTESMVSGRGREGWHIVRAFHQTGRCVSCGACERACPLGIKLTYLTEMLNRDMLEEYGFEAGMSEDAQPPFAAFTLDDRNRFVR